jgi:hypothetical protein
MCEAGIQPRWLNVDDAPTTRYLRTHIVPDDVMPISKKFAWLTDQVVPMDVVREHPTEGSVFVPVPVCLMTETPKKVWDLLIELNDRTICIDEHDEAVSNCFTWEVRAYWIREALRRYGVGISFRARSK